MQQMVIGTKYQIVIPKEVRKKIKGLRPGAKVKVYPIDKDTVAIKKVSKNWADENYGILKKYWRGIDPIKELEKMRDEWEDHLNELGR